MTIPRDPTPGGRFEEEADARFQAAKKFRRRPEENPPGYALDEHCMYLGAAPDEARMIASSILVRPQAHIEALVSAGVLEKVTHDRFGERVVFLVCAPPLPHVHDWRVTRAVDGQGPGAHVEIECRWCKEIVMAPNSLPIVVPK